MLMRASRFNTALEALDAPTRQHDMMQVVAHLSVTPAKIGSPSTSSPIEFPGVRKMRVDPSRPAAK